MQAFLFLHTRHILIFHVDVAYRRFFSLLKYSALFRFSFPSPQTPPSLDFSVKFPSHAYRCLHIKISPTGPFPSFAVLSFCGFKKCGQPFFRRCCSERPPESLLSVISSRFLTVCAHKQNGGLLFLLLTRGEGWRYSNIRREGGGERGRRGGIVIEARCSLVLSLTLFTAICARDITKASIQFWTMVHQYLLVGMCT